MATPDPDRDRFPRILRGLVRPLVRTLIARGVIGDFREPDILRFGFAPAYLRFADMAEAARHLAEVLQSGEWQRSEFSERAAVT